MFRIPVKPLRNTIFARLVFMYLAVILPIILLGIYLYHWSYNNASQETSRNTLMQLSSYLEDLHREIEWMEIQQFDLMQERELRKIALTWGYMDNVEKKTSMNYLLHRLTTIKKTSPYIKDIHVHIRSIDKTISTDLGMQDFNHAKYKDSRSSVAVHERRLMMRDESLYLSASLLGSNKTEEPLFVVQIELDRDQLRTSLNNTNMYPHSGSFLVSDEMEFILVTGEISSNLLKKYYSELNGTSDQAQLIEIQGKPYQINTLRSQSLGLSVVTYIPEDLVRRPLNKFYTWAWLFAIVSVIAILIFFYFTYKLVHRPLLLLVRRFKSMEEGDLNIHIEHQKNDEFGFLYERYNQMLNRLQTLIDQDYKQKLMMQKAELKQLQSQINPHFLYNSFFILNSLAKVEDVERIEQFTNMLGEYFRFITRNTDEYILLAEEVHHARTYSEIQRLRFSRRIQVQFDELPKTMERIQVPRLIIQPIIENAFEHSLEQMSEEGMLRITFRADHQATVIIVEDNGNSMSDADIEELHQRVTSMNASDEMTGLINIHRRIFLTFGEGSGLRLSRSVLNGLQVTIRILRKEENQDVQTIDRR